MDESEKIREELINALLSANQRGATHIFKRIIAGWSTLEIADGLLAPVMDEIGRRWEEGEISLSKLYTVGGACESLVDTFLPAGQDAVKRPERAAIVTLEDFHTIAKKTLLAVFSSEGVGLLDYGEVASVPGIVEKVERDGIDVLLVSVHKASLAHMVGHLTKLLKLDNSRVRVVVGGAPFASDRELWREVGADAAGLNAGDALGIVKRFLGEESEPS